MVFYASLPDSVFKLALLQEYLTLYFVLLLFIFLAWTKLCNSHPFPSHAILNTIQNRTSSFGSGYTYQSLYIHSYC